MELNFLMHINYIAVVVSSIIFFLLGSFWFSALFRKQWSEELQRHKIAIRQPTAADLTTKMLLTFAANLVASFAMACLVS